MFGFELECEMNYDFLVKLIIIDRIVVCKDVEVFFLIGGFFMSKIYEIFINGNG